MRVHDVSLHTEARRVTIHVERTPQKSRLDYRSLRCLSVFVVASVCCMPECVYVFSYVFSSSCEKQNTLI